MKVTADADGEIRFGEADETDEPENVAAEPASGSVYPIGADVAVCQRPSRSADGRAGRAVVRSAFLVSVGHGSMARRRRPFSAGRAAGARPGSGVASGHP